MPTDAYSLTHSGAKQIPIGLVSVPVAASEATTADVLSSLRSGGAVNDPERIYFEMLLGEMPIGVTVHSLIEQGDKKDGGYSYELEMEAVMPNGARINSVVTSHLNSNYEPKNVEVRREVKVPNGTSERTVTVARIGADTVTIRRGIQGETLSENTVACPDRPFVFAIEFIIQRVDLERLPSFALREFDVEDWTVKTQHFRVETGSDGIRRLVSREDNGEVGYVFEVDGKGELFSWTEPPLPVVLKRCSRERFEELRKSMQER